VLFRRLMVTAKGPRLIDSTSCFGDPESQVADEPPEIRPGALLAAVPERRLDRVEPEWADEAALVVVMAPGDTPASR
jgi:phosphoribosylamine--glycine ligase